MIELLAISGKMASGKTTVAEYLRDHQGYSILSIGNMIKKASTFVIDDMSELYEYMRHMVDDRKRLESLFFELTSSYDAAFQETKWTKDSKGLYVKTQPYRELTQMIATKVRNHLGTDVWVQFCIKEALDLHKQKHKVVVDDLRLAEEKILFEQHHFHIARLDISPEVQRERILKDYGEIKEEQLHHITETSLDLASFDYRLEVSTLSKSEVFAGFDAFISKK